MARIMLGAMVTVRAMGNPGRPSEESVAGADFAAAAPALFRLLDWLRLGIVVIDGEGAVLHANPAARAALEGSPGPTPGPEESEERAGRAPLRGVQSLLAAACRGGRLESVQAINVETAPGRRLHLLAVPLERAAPADPPTARVPAALLLLHRPEACRLEGCEPLLRDLYRLTPAEARVARGLADGLNVDEVAAHLGLSRHTVRTHLKHALAKTGTRSQRELVRVILSGPLSLLGSLAARPEDPR